MISSSILTNHKSPDGIDISVIDKWVAGYIYMLSYAKRIFGRCRYPGRGGCGDSDPNSSWESSQFGLVRGRCR